MYHYIGHLATIFIHKPTIRVSRYPKSLHYISLWYFMLRFVMLYYNVRCISLIYGKIQLYIIFHIEDYIPVCSGRISTPCLPVLFMLPRSLRSGKK